MTDPHGFSGAFAYVGEWHEKLQETKWWHSFELPDGRVIEGVSSLDSQKARLAQFQIPDNLTGKRVLDVGTWDGWFAMEMERRGAEVVAIDRWPNPRFLEIQQLLGSRVDYRQLSVYDLDPRAIGRFDIVLFMGVLYHLKHPLLGLERVCAVAKDLVAVESFVLRDRHRPGLGVEEHTLMEFYENEEFGGQFDNWTAPTLACLLAFCRAAGFVRVELNNVHEYGAAVSCYRSFTPSLVTVQPAPAKLHLLTACHSGNDGINFHSLASDDYVTCRLLADGLQLTKDAVWAQAGGYDAVPVFVGISEGAWHVNFKLPPGLSPGWHPVTIRTPQGESNPCDIAVDIPLIADSLSIEGVHDSMSWEPFRVSLQHGLFSVWVTGLARNADVNNVKILVDGRRQSTIFVDAPSATGARQANARMIPGSTKGVHKLCVEFGDARSESVDFAAAD
ncbi:MAG TPA: DUF1698 domain-containing protein [Bryobacteraceae bacterium]|jgi:tRNA (mo5U34)-methyltransferase|nr:DUF1698 domain-containing protein [Bryobacteraceae bacterium]